VRTSGISHASCQHLTAPISLSAGLPGIPHGGYVGGALAPAAHDDSGPAAPWTISPCCTDIEDKNESEEKLKEN
jgi:hypothetical protein